MKNGSGWNCDKIKVKEDRLVMQSNQKQEKTIRLTNVEQWNLHIVTATNRLIFKIVNCT